MTYFQPVQSPTTTPARTQSTSLSTRSLSLSTLSYGSNQKSTSTSTLVAPGTPYNLTGNSSTPSFGGTTSQGASPWPDRLRTIGKYGTYAGGALGVGIAGAGAASVIGAAATSWGYLSTGFLAGNFTAGATSALGAVGGVFGSMGSFFGTAGTFLATNPVGWAIGIGAAVGFGVKWLFSRGKDKVRDSHAVEIFNGSRDSGDGEGARKVADAIKGSGYGSFFVQQKRITQTQANFLKSNGGFTRDSVTKAVEEGVLTAAQGKEVLSVIFFGLTKDGRVANASTRTEDKQMQGISDLFEKESSKTSQAGYLMQHLAKFDSLYASRRTSAGGARV